MIGTGIYTPVEAAALLKAPATEIRRWAFGYGRTRDGNKRHYPPLIRTELPVLDGQQALTFVELVEMMFIKGFRQAGVTWSNIREAAAVAARLYQSEHPFAMKQFFADPGGVYALLREIDGGESLVRLVGSGQHVSTDLVRPYTRNCRRNLDSPRG